MLRRAAQEKIGDSARDDIQLVYLKRKIEIAIYMEGILVVPIFGN
tara:strand:- start:277 stop:411 length:135 start_codon:yes stop_codon:yes gene_type:complete